MKQTALRIALAFVLLAAFIARGHGADSVPTATGGIGIAEQERLEARAGEFNLKLVFTLAEGNYVADVGIRIQDGAGRTLVEAVAPGPLFFARLAPGAYAVTASYGGRAIVRRIKTGEGSHTEYFRWPADPQTDLIVRDDARAGPAPRQGAVAAKSAAMREPRRSPAGGIATLSGGIGEDEVAALKAKEADYNVKLVFTLSEGNYVADVGVVLKNAKGETVVERASDGPIFLARLPAGSYAAAATYRGTTQTRSLKAGSRLHTEYFRWPANPQTDLPVSIWTQPDSASGDKSAR